MIAQGRTSRASRGEPVRYAVVGLGYFAQAAILPAFKNARKNSELAAFVSGDPQKLRKLAKKYRVEHNFSYEEYDELLQGGLIDAVYIALPNSMHHEYTVRAANAGIHVLCEKPLAVTVEECQEMIDAARENNVRLMTAYRLHFEPANLSAIEICQSGKIGEPRLFNSTFTMQVQDKDNIRLQADKGGGPLYDIGIYCINATRYLFQDEPVEVVGWSASSGDNRFSEVEEMFSAVLRFPNERLATFICSFGAADNAWYQVVGTKGDICVENAYEYAQKLSYELTVNGKTRSKEFPKHDQVAPELEYFSKCVREGIDPEPSGEEGLADVRIIQALYESAQRSESMSLDDGLQQRLQSKPRPNMRQAMKKPPVREPKLVKAESPSG